VPLLMKFQPISGMWQTRDGTYVCINKMDDDHLANTIAMLDRVAHQRARLIMIDADQYAFTHCSTQAKEDANTLYDLRDWPNEVVATIVFPEYAELVAEREKRKDEKARAWVKEQYRQFFAFDWGFV
jgi:hypothetical protein